MQTQAYRSVCGHFRVQVIKRDGVEYMRVTSDRFILADGRSVPSLTLHPTRSGPVRVAAGWLWGDFRTTAEVARIIPLDQLEKDV